MAVNDSGEHRRKSIETRPSAGCRWAHRNQNMYLHDLLVHPHIRKCPAWSDGFFWPRHPGRTMWIWDNIQGGYLLSAAVSIEDKPLSRWGGKKKRRLNFSKPPCKNRHMKRHLLYDGFFSFAVVRQTINYSYFFKIVFASSAVMFPASTWSSVYASNASYSSFSVS